MTTSGAPRSVSLVRKNTASAAMRSEIHLSIHIPSTTQRSYILAYRNQPVPVCLFVLPVFPLGRQMAQAFIEPIVSRRKEPCGDLNESPMNQRSDFCSYSEYHRSIEPMPKLQGLVVIRLILKEGRKEMPHRPPYYPGFPFVLLVGRSID